MMLHHPVKGALAMILAGFVFAVINTLTQILGANSTIDSASVALYQYLFALLFLAPSLFKAGLKPLKTQHPWLHILRVGISVIGIQCWISALIYPIPIWQGIALIMTSPLFATLGAALFLKEKVGFSRITATLFGFCGAMIILKPWSEDFNPVALLPLAAALCWAIYSLMVKKLSSSESPTTIVVYLFILITPFNLLSVLQSSQFTSPDIMQLGYLILLGFLTAIAQLAIAKAYNLADAAYLQPFDFLKLPLNVLAGWLIFQAQPPGRLWLGAALIIFSILYITYQESGHRKR
ncbi:DMT family transporter [Testudinibacter sp. TR-2022]|nr:DMT family transporter [Pasteurellaceae bacterium Phil31]TNH08072.1 DMT family transporter [Testudinibacter sp. TR-2022]TNH10284.1 DMT family transporter [Testudinibacter sp. TR-2022]TNH12169.1 DMT family transporter [Testudinibacter sp. TR-2022]TNH16118.1 DMT family transporter [Testudinibacter sp. TR-2022]